MNKMKYLLYLIIILLVFPRNSYAGVDFRYIDGYGEALRQETQKMVENVKFRNKDQVDMSYERIREIIRNLPDKGRNAELLEKYLAILENIRDLSKKSDDVLTSGVERNDLFNQIQSLIAPGGAHLMMRSEVIKISHEQIQTN
jgi:hypothetical protein